MNSIKELRALFGRAEEMENIIDKNTDVIAERIRHWCLNEANRLDSLRKDICGLISERFDALTSKSIGFVRHRYGAGSECHYSDGTISFASREKNDGSRDIYDIEVEDACKNHIGVFHSKLPKPSDRHGWRIDTIRRNADIGNMSVDFWVDAKLWLAIESERLDFFIGKLKKVLEELVNFQKERFERISNACGEIASEEGKKAAIMRKEGQGDDNPIHGAAAQ